jgi:hypothetical protein
MWKRLAILELGILLCIAAVIVCAPYFVRARVTSGSNTCLGHLRQIYGAKEQWARERDKSTGNVVTWEDILPYFWPYCPAGGEYTIGSMGTDPSCTIVEHTEAYWAFKALTEPTDGGDLQSRGQPSSQAR